MLKPHYLPDVNLLVSLLAPSHEHHMDGTEVSDFSNMVKRRLNAIGDDAEIY